MRSVEKLAVLTLVLICLATAPAGAQNILVLNEECGGSAEYFPAALSNLGFTFTETNDDATFFAALTDGTAWDVVIVDEYANGLGGATLTEIQNVIAGGAMVYMNYWTWDGTTATSFETTLGSHYSAPIDIFRWDPAHPLFTNPNAVPDFVPSQDTCGTDGAFFDAIGGGQAVAGYTATPTANQHGVVVGNSGRTVLFGGIIGLFDGDEDSDGRADGLEFAENVCQFLLGGVRQAAPIPTTSPVGLMALIALLAGAGFIVVRRM